VDEPTLLREALSGDGPATRRLVSFLLPAVQARVARVLVRQPSRAARDVRQHVEDIAQDVFVALFEQDARVLRMWEPSRGLSLRSFCALVAERETLTILRSGRRNPWKESATELESLELELEHVRPFDLAFATRELLDLVNQRLQMSLSTRGLELFERLILDEESVDSVCTSTGMSPDAVYAWKSRLGKIARKIASEAAQSDPRLVAASETSSSVHVGAIGLHPRPPHDENAQ
jgi:DNA-directed RNA polymerase specialized sigma24 family protein